MVRSEITKDEEDNKGFSKWTFIFKLKTKVITKKVSAEKKKT